MLTIISSDPVASFSLSYGCSSIGPSSKPKRFPRYLKRGRASSAAERWKEGFCTCAKGSGDPDRGPENGFDQGKDEKQSVDWDKAWSNFSKKKKWSFFSMFDMDKYVTRAPQNREYPLSEETDPFKRTERATLRFWTDPKFTLAGFGVIVGLFIYMVVIVGAPPPK